MYPDTHGLEHLQDFADLASRLASFQIDDETQSCSRCHCQVLLCDLQLFASCSDGISKLFCISNLHSYRSGILHVSSRMSISSLPIGNIMAIPWRFMRYITDRERATEYATSRPQPARRSGDRVRGTRLLQHGGGLSRTSRPTSLSTRDAYRRWSSSVARP